ncbi:hypothetical protein AAMO2058_001447300 [Amorphochlora amoebiformis]
MEGIYSISEYEDSKLSSGCLMVLLEKHSKEEENDAKSGRRRKNSYATKIPGLQFEPPPPPPKRKNKKLKPPRPSVPKPKRNNPPALEQPKEHPLKILLPPLGPSASSSKEHKPMVFPASKGRRGEHGDKVTVSHHKSQKSQHREHVSFEVVVIDCKAPPEDRKKEMAVSINLAQLSIHCYEHKSVKAIYSIKDLAQLEASASDPKRITLFNQTAETNTKSVMSSETLSYMCEFVFATLDQASDFCSVCRICNESIVLSDGNKAGKPAWIPDADTKYCMLESCHKPFSVTNRRHHCRRCGFVVCGTCSSHTAALPETGSLVPARVCDRCFRDTVISRVSSFGTRSTLSVQDNSKWVLNAKNSADAATKGHGSDGTNKTKVAPDEGHSTDGNGPSESFDMYGFPIREGNCHSAPTWATYVKAQRKRWSKYLSNNTYFKFNKTDKEVKNLVRRGIPPELRGHLWPLLSGSNLRQRSARKDYFKDLIAKAEKGDPLVLEQITKDLNRTFPDHPAFAGGEYHPKLKRVLMAYSQHNHLVGYCQSMNFICASLLLFMEEEDAFWLFVTIIEDVCCVVPGDSPELPENHPPIVYHEAGLGGVLIDQAVLQDLVKKYLPKISGHFEDLEMKLDAVSTNWLMCIFATSLPTEVVLHIWDCLFLEGIKIIFRASLSILKVAEKELLACESFEEVLYLFREMREKPIDVERFMRTCFDSMWIPSFSMEKITKLRTKHIPMVVPEEILEKAKREKEEKSRKIIKTDNRTDNRTPSIEDAPPAPKQPPPSPISEAEVRAPFRPKAPKPSAGKHLLEALRNNNPKPNRPSNHVSGLLVKPTEDYIEIQTTPSTPPISLAHANRSPETRKLRRPPPPPPRNSKLEASEPILPHPVRPRPSGPRPSGPRPSRPKPLPPRPKGENPNRWSSAPVPPPRRTTRRKTKKLNQRGLETTYSQEGAGNYNTLHGPFHTKRMGGYPADNKQVDDSYFASPVAETGMNNLKLAADGGEPDGFVKVDSEVLT